MTKEEIKKINIKELHPFTDHPYKVEDNEEMYALRDSIYQCGLLSPILVRPRAEGGYEVISGHRRVRALQLLKVDSIAARVCDMSDEEAILIMVDSNLHREHILPSEKAKAYKMKMDAMRRQGERTDLTLSPMATKSAIDSAAEIGSAAILLLYCGRLTNVKSLFGVGIAKIKGNRGITVVYQKKIGSERGKSLHIYVNKVLTAYRLIKIGARKGIYRHLVYIGDIFVSLASAYLQNSVIIGKPYPFCHLPYFFIYRA